MGFPATQATFKTAPLYLVNYGPEKEPALKGNKKARRLRKAFGVYKMGQ